MDLLQDNPRAVFEVGGLPCVARHFELLLFLFALVVMMQFLPRHLLRAWCVWLLVTLLVVELQEVALAIQENSV